MAQANQTSLIKMTEARRFCSSPLKRYAVFTAPFEALGVGVGAFWEINLEISKIENIEKSRFPFFDPIPTSEAHISVRLSATSDSLCQNGSHLTVNIYNIHSLGMCLNDRRYNRPILIKNIHSRVSYQLPTYQK